MPNPFAPGLRPWARRTRARIAAAVTPLPAGEIMTDETGGVYGGDGTTAVAGLQRLARVNEVVLASSLLDSAGYAFAIVDQAGRVAVGVRPDGTLDAKVNTADGSIARAKLAADVTTRLLVDPVGGMFRAMPAGSPWTWVVSDDNGRIALGVRADGTVDAKIMHPAGSVPRSALGADVSLPQTISASVAAWAVTDQNDRIAIKVDAAGRVTIPSFDPTTASTLATLTGKALTSGPNITCPGDSLTAGAGGSGTTYPGVLQTLVGSTRTVTNLGVGGESSRGIAARQGGQPYLMLPAGGQIPTTGGVTVTLSLPSGTAWPLLQGSSTLVGTLAGVSGRLSLAKPSGGTNTHLADDVYTFTRLADGAAVPVNRPQPFYVTANEALRGDIFVYWVGRNNVLETDQIMADLAAMIEHQSAARKRFLVLGVINSSAEPSNSTNWTAINAVNARMLQTYGRRFVDVRRYLIDYALADTGTTPTSQDNTDISNDVVPTSLRSDAVHLLGPAYTAIATNLVFPRLNELGWM